MIQTDYIYLLLCIGQSFNCLLQNELEAYSTLQYSFKSPKPRVLAKKRNMDKAYDVIQLSSKPQSTNVRAIKQTKISVF